MTLLGYQDGANAQSGVSYLEIANLIQQKGTQPEQDLEQLWRRIVFSMCLSNTDDHLRNHGFLKSKRGIVLSPAYDLNPNPRATGLSLNVDAHDNRLDLDLARSVLPFFRLDLKRAEDILAEVRRAVNEWRTVARSAGIARKEIEQMEPAFRLATTPADRYAANRKMR